MPRTRLSLGVEPTIVPTPTSAASVGSNNLFACFSLRGLEKKLSAPLIISKFVVSLSHQLRQPELPYAWREAGLWWVGESSENEVPVLSPEMTGHRAIGRSGRCQGGEREEHQHSEPLPPRVSIQVRKALTQPVTFLLFG